MDNEPVTGFTNEECKISGTYQCENHWTYQVNVEAGEKFPSCLKDQINPHDAIWVLVKETKEHLLT